MPFQYKEKSTECKCGHQRYLHWVKGGSCSRVDCHCTRFHEPKVSPRSLQDCSEKGCENRVYARGLCSPHYLKLWRLGRKAQREARAGK